MVTHFTQVPGEYGNGRFHYIAERVSGSSANVEVVTSTFSHSLKKQRVITAERVSSINYRLTMLYEPGYQQNVSLRRLLSHRVFANNLREYLAKRRRPDVVYCSVPSLDAAQVAADYSKEHGIRFIIDVQDLWPEAFSMVFHVPVVSDALLYPLRRQAEYVYSAADDIIAVSETYANRALRVNPRCESGHTVFLGTELSRFDALAKQNRPDREINEEIWLAYVGTLGHSYDLGIVIDSLRIVKNKCRVKFVVMGDGPLRSRFETQARELGVDAWFTGRLEYGKMVGLLSVCDIAVNPIRRRAAQSIINKHADYAAAGLPVINTQESPEYRALVEGYEMGLNCKPGNAQDLADKIIVLCQEPAMRRRMGENSRRLAEEKFDRAKTYGEIERVLLGRGSESE